MVAPLGWQFVWNWAFVTLLFFLPPAPPFAADAEPIPIHWRFITAFFTALGHACITAFERRSARAAMGGATREEWRSAVLAFHRGMRTGEPGPDPSLDRAVLVLIERRKRSSSRGWGIVLGVFGMLLILTGATYLDGAALAAWAALWVGLFGCAYLMEFKLWRPRIARLEAVLRGRAGGAHDHGEAAPQDLPPTRGVG